VLAITGVPAAAQSSTAAAPQQPPSCTAAVGEAARRFGLPERWIVAVMREESRGQPRAVSPAGALGCMQVMPSTYADLRLRYRLGPDPFAIRDNVLAGSAYLREMYDRYGGVGMLAAYNAGPKRWEDHLAGVRPLPRETVGYLARLGPVLNLGDLPIAPEASAPTLVSPFSAPIFVRWSVVQTDDPARRDPNDVRQVVAANVTVVPSSGDLFVRQSRGAVAAADVQPGRKAGADRPPSEEQLDRVPASSTTPADRLFVSRPGPGGGG
jgi:hypothetical protein